MLEPIKEYLTEQVNKAPQKGAFFIYGAVAKDALLICNEVDLGSTPTRSTYSLEVKWLRCPTVYGYGEGSNPFKTAIGLLV